MTTMRDSTWKAHGLAELLALTFLLLAGIRPGTAEEVAQDGRHPTIRISPATIEKNAFYNGCRVRIEGTVGSGSKAVIAIRGPEHADTFTKKVHLGPIWLNSGKVNISGVPTVFLCFSAEPLDRMLDRKSIDQYELDGEAIAWRMKFEPDQGPKDDFVGANYLALRIRQGRYRFGHGEISMGASDGASTAFSLEFEWPKTAPSAPYEVWLYEVREGAVVGVASIPLEVKRVGFPAWIAKLANNHSSQYGILAVVIAAMAGFGIDLIAVRLFGKRRGAGH